MDRITDRNRILSSFARFFAPVTFGKTKTPSIDTFDCNHELLAQFCEGHPDNPVVDEWAQLFVGCPLSNDRRQLTSETIFWCPSGWPEGRYTSLASSRLGNRLREDPNIADALRNFLVNSDPKEVIVSGAHTTLDQPLQRGCQLFARPILKLVPLPRTRSKSKPAISNQWIASTLAAAQTSGQQESIVYFDADSIKVDELVFAICDVVKVVHARKKGTIHELVMRYARPSDENGRRPGPLVMLRVDQDQPDLLQDYREAKGVSWYLCPPADESTESPSDESNDRTTGQPHANIIGLAEFDNADEFLNHWTRGSQQPAPDQTEPNQFDDLLLGEQSPSALNTLRRILVSQKLLANGRLIKGGHRVVCFTETPLSEFPARRIFRPQLSRWDFEPWGLAIRRSALEKIGCRKVEYVQLDESKKTADSPFQVTINPNSNVDWSIEREWRVVGDIDLRKLATDEAIVFVPDEIAARSIAGLSRWPIVMLRPNDSRTVS